MSESSAANAYSAAISRHAEMSGGARADAARSRGQLMGGTLASIGEMISQIPQQRAQLAQVKLQAERAERERKKEEEAGEKQLWLADVFKRHGGLTDTALAEIQSRDPILWNSLAKDKAAAEKDVFDLQTSRHKANQEEVDWFLNKLAVVKDQDSYDRFKYRMLIAKKDVSGLPEQFDPSVIDEANRSLMTAAQRLAADAPKPPPSDYTLGNQRFSGQTNQPIATGTGSAEGGFTLSPGGKRFDAQGNEIASVPERPEGAGAAEPLVAIMGPDGKPVLVRRSQAEGKAPASSREQGRNVTSGDVNRIADLDTSLNDVTVLEGTLFPTDPNTGKPVAGAAAATGTKAKLQASLPNWATEMLGGWGTDAKSKQAVIDRVKQVIGKALEGGVLRKEDEAKYEKILPTIYDPPAVVKTKLAGLKSALTQRRETLLDALEDANYDVSSYRGRTPTTAGPAPRVGAWTITEVP